MLSAEAQMSPIRYHLQPPAPNVNIQHVDQERIKGRGGKIAGTDETGNGWTRGLQLGRGAIQKRRGTDNNRAV